MGKADDIRPYHEKVRLTRSIILDEIGYDFIQARWWTKWRRIVMCCGSILNYNLTDWKTKRKNGMY